MVPTRRARQDRGGTRPAELTDLAREVLSIPTASMHEHGVLDYLRHFAANRGLQYEEDDAGNAYVAYRRGRARRPLALTAHMDHPGFVVTKVNGRTIELEFRGGLSAEYGKDEAVRLYGDGTATARITRVHDRETPRGRVPRRIRGATARLDGEGTAQVGQMALWDVDAFRLRGDVLHARACDDLAGCVAVLAALDRAAAEHRDGHLVGVFTRAEEVGLLGAAAAARSGTIPDNAIVVAVETSSMAGGRAEQGAGPIIRVGDRQHVFNSSVTLWMTALAGEMAEEDAGFGYQRRLMDGGTTEATAFDLMGYETGAACIALGNYHNAGPRGRVRAETVHLGDLEGLVRLFLRMLEDVPRYERRIADARRAWERIARDAARQLKATRGGS